tara:strand:- start:399 stop:995 length:597 start_codon:yes stop_codon:yes gene_type:complete
MITPIAHKFKVFDDFISPTYQNVIEQLLLSPEVPWNWQESMDYKTGDKRGGGYPQFTVNVFEDGKIWDTSLYHTMIGLMSKVVDDILPDYRPVRIRGILQTPIKDDIVHFPPHTDTTDSGGFSAIYYVTDATGDTYLFQERDINDEIGIDNRFEHQWSPVDKVSPKKGRLIVFPSNYYHAGSPTKDERRVLINFNFMP